jgi:hypothetical protein
VIERRQQAGLARETLRVAPRSEQLQRDDLPALAIARAVHAAHPARACQRKDLEAVVDTKVQIHRDAEPRPGPVTRGALADGTAQASRAPVLL